MALVTGSNMTGKTTFLRTVGVNLVLAYAGAPVCAESFRCSQMKLWTSMRTVDSLEQGVSSFYAELLRIKRIVEAARSERRILCLLDEVFKGTNNRERLIGGRALIATLAGGNGFGLVTTHDLELAELERQLPNVTNVHFQETVAEGALHFDYQLRPGPCPTTNALRIMALEGLPVDIPASIPPR